MANTFDDLIDKLTLLETELQAAMPNIALEYAQNAQALVINKIQQGSGVEGRQYSTNEMLATQSSFLQKGKFKPDVMATTLGRDANGKLLKGGNRTGKGNIAKRGTGKRLRWIKFKNASKAVPVMTLRGGYKELRQIQGLPSGKVNLTYSGRMFQNIKVLRTENKEPYRVIAFIGGVQKETQNKLLGNYKRYGDFLAITPKIAKVINIIPKNRILELTKKILSPS